MKINENHDSATGILRNIDTLVRHFPPSPEQQLTEIRDLLTVYHEIVRSGKQKNPEIGGLENDRSRHPERRLTCPDMFLKEAY